MVPGFPIYCICPKGQIQDKGECRMNTKETAQIIVNTAKDQLNLMGLDGSERARGLIDTLSCAGAGDIPPEDIAQAYRQIEQEEADTKTGKPPIFHELPDKTQQEAVLARLRQAKEYGQFPDEEKALLEDTLRFLEDYWSAAE